MLIPALRSQRFRVRPHLTASTDARAQPVPLFPPSRAAVRVDDASTQQELVKRHIDPKTRAHTTGKKAAKGANAPPMALANQANGQIASDEPLLRLAVYPEPGFHYVVAV